MGLTSFARAAWLVLLAVTTSSLAACDHHCGLGEHDRVTAHGTVPCCGGSAFQDVTLKGATSDPEFSLSNTASPGGGPGDAYLVPTSCTTLFTGPYPGAAPQCQIYLGPAQSGKATDHVKLAPGTYRVYVQGYSSAVEASPLLVDVYIWDYSCGPLIQ
jgi:hypothetical protein